MFKHGLSRITDNINLKLLVYLGYLTLGIYAYIAISHYQNPNSTPVTPKNKNMLKENHNEQFIFSEQLSLFGIPEKAVTVLQDAQWQVVGIIVNPIGSNIVIVKIDNVEKLLRQGDKIDYRTRIIKINKDTIFISRNGKTQKILLYKD